MRPAVTAMTDPAPVRLTPMGRLVMALPVGRRLGLTILVLIALLGLVIGIGFLLESSGRELPRRVLIPYWIALGLPAWLLMCLFARWHLSFVLKRVARLAPFPDAVPGIWRLWLLPYSRAEICYIHAQGRGADLFAASLLVFVSLGMIYTIFATT